MIARLTEVSILVAELSPIERLEAMPFFVPKVPKKVEDLFIYRLDSKTSSAFMEAVLADGSRLYLGSGHGLSLPNSPWPLYFNVPRATGPTHDWIDQSFADAQQFIEEKGAPPEVWEKHLQVFGTYMKIDHLELEKCPRLHFRVSLGTNDPEMTRWFDYEFPSPIVEFIPLERLPEALPSPRSAGV